MSISFLNLWYFWHNAYPDYAARMRAMSKHVCNSELHKYFVDNMTLTPKD